jgi:GH35 family endo-1,4-beta-xylanase
MMTFCGAVLHDLGLVPAYRRDNRFEVDGADAARQFCSKHQVPPERADLVWGIRDPRWKHDNQ